MERIGKALTLTCLVYLLMACNDPPLQGLEPRKSVGASHQQVKRVAGEYNAEGQPTVFLLLGAGRQNLLDVYLLRANIREGYTVQSLSFNRPEIELRAQWKGGRFIQSTEHSTEVNLTIRTLTPDEAVIEVSATLVNPVTGGYLTLPSSSVRVQGAHLQALIADQ